MANDDRQNRGNNDGSASMVDEKDQKKKGMHGHGKDNNPGSSANKEDSEKKEEGEGGGDME